MSQQVKTKSEEVVKQFSSSLEQMKLEKTLTFSAGQLLTLGIPNLDLLFDDEDGTVISHFFQGKYVIHSSLKKEPSLSLMKKAKEVCDEVNDAFNEHGIETYTWSENDKQQRYNEFLGYELTGQELDIPNYGKVKEYKRCQRYQ